MIEMKFKGKVSKGPEPKVSAKGVSYTKFTVEVPIKQGAWPKRVYLTAFGAHAQDAERLGLGMEVEVVADPSARAYLDKLGKPAGLLEGVVRSCKVLSAPAPTQAPAFEMSDEDIPF